MANNKQLINQEKKLTTASVAEQLMLILKNHIGHEHAITRENLYKIVFGKHLVFDLSDWMRWEVLRRAMHNLRLNSNCFVVSEPMNRTYVFYVAKDSYDIEYYRDSLQSKIEGMKRMDKRAQRAIKEQWHNKIWRIVKKKINYKNTERLL